MRQHLGQQPCAARFYLAGGPALALRLGHRISVDLDFFSATDEGTQASRQLILSGLAPFAPLVLEAADGHFLLDVSGLPGGFCGYFGARRLTRRAASRILPLSLEPAAIGRSWW